MFTDLRYYQKEAIKAINDSYNAGYKNVLAVMPTGTGKTAVIAKEAEQCVNGGNRVLILAHRDNLITQARDKLYNITGLSSALEKGHSACAVDSPEKPPNVVVGSVQTISRKKRLDCFAPDYFDMIIIDEAHHAVSSSYQRILTHFNCARVLGVTATPDRGDHKNLGCVTALDDSRSTLSDAKMSCRGNKVSDAEDFNANTGAAACRELSKAIADGYLAPIKTLTIPLELDISSVGCVTALDDSPSVTLDPCSRPSSEYAKLSRRGNKVSDVEDLNAKSTPAACRRGNKVSDAEDFNANTGAAACRDLSKALEPSLEKIAQEMKKHCLDRKTLVFLPLIKTAQKFRDILCKNGFSAAEINGCVTALDYFALNF